MLRLFDTARGEVAPVELRQAGQVSMYVCGPTVYGPPHLGHGRMSLVFDVLRRYLEWTGLEVTHVSNVTDIDDKIIERGRLEGRDPAEVARRNEKMWWRAMDAIGVKRPTHDPHATAYVDQMVALVEQLVELGVAYETNDGVYFQAERVADYGLLGRQSLDSLRAGARVEGNEEKRSPVDFAVWKKAKPDEPSWPSPWGPGRPGWHTECVVMSLDLLGDGFDLHGGGHDLAFPHHENERAQAVTIGRPFARHWVHNGFAEVAGEKMSKSLGNFTNLVDLIESVDPRSYRLLVLRAHYRSPIDVTPASTADASAALARLDAFARRAAASLNGAGASAELAPDEAAIKRFRQLMDDDLNTPGAMALLFELVRRVNTALDLEDHHTAGPLALAALEIAAAVGIPLAGVAQAGGLDEEAAVPHDVRERARARDAARAAKDWATADAVRSELQHEGWVVEDGPAGTTVRPS